MIRRRRSIILGVFLATEIVTRGAGMLGQESAPSSAQGTTGQI
jgi:hypothetical protein